MLTAVGGRVRFEKWEMYVYSHRPTCSANRQKEGNMSLIAKKKQFEKLTEGLHNVTITKIEDIGVVDTAFGAKDRAAIYFTAQDQKDKEGKPVDARMSVNKVLGAKSTLGQLIVKLGIPVGEEFDLNDLIGTKCQVVIEHKEKDGEIYANVVSVLKLKSSAPTEV